IVCLLLNHGADVNAAPARFGGRTALEGAAEHGRVDVLRLLLSAGACIDGPVGHKHYQSALRFATKQGRR
ncbi:hypothetical protein AOQ84DRAFT_269706, partial [Glonium stellatum]